MTKAKKIPAMAWDQAGEVGSSFENPAAFKKSDSTIGADFQLAMGVATPLDHDAHRSPANQVVSIVASALRRNSDSGCGEIKP